jgi:hypothetical protein
MVGRNFQVRGKIIDDVLLFHCRFQVKIHWQDFQQLYKPAVLCDNNAVPNIGNSQPVLHAFRVMLRAA